MPKSLKTQFAPAERANPDQLKKDAMHFSKSRILKKIANSVSSMLLILNPQRQIVYSNKLFLDFLNLTDSNEIIGKRTGEAVECIHATLLESGCGTSEFCRTCGSVGAFLESQLGMQSVKECRITTCNNEALDFRVTATPYVEQDITFTIFAIQDISNEKRRETLERVFFHDVLNSASGVSGLSALLQDVENIEDVKTLAKTLKHAADNIIDEIQSQRHIVAAERGELELNYSQINSYELLEDVADLFSNHKLSSEKIIAIERNSVSTDFNSDPVILRRILGNLVKNAIEASPLKATITLSCKLINDRVLFSVHNITWMKPEIQMQLFKRSFSTKGEGRGLGTYSIKLFGEKYLKGKVWFISAPESGTVFYLEVPQNSEMIWHFHT